VDTAFDPRCTSEADIRLIALLVRGGRIGYQSHCHCNDSGEHQLWSPALVHLNASDYERDAMAYLSELQHVTTFLTDTVACTVLRNGHPLNGPIMANLRLSECSSASGGDSEITGGVKDAWRQICGPDEAADVQELALFVTSHLRKSRDDDDDDDDDDSMGAGGKIRRSHTGGLAWPVLVQGAAGAGTTWLARMLIYYLCLGSDHTCLPFAVDMGQLLIALSQHGPVSPVLSLRRLIHLTLSSIHLTRKKQGRDTATVHHTTHGDGGRGPKLPAVAWEAALVDAFQRRRLIIVVDGLHQLSASHREMVSWWVIGLARMGHHTICTSRSAGDTEQIFRGASALVLGMELGAAHSEDIRGGAQGSAGKEYGKGGVPIERPHLVLPSARAHIQSLLAAVDAPRRRSVGRMEDTLTGVKPGAGKTPQLNLRRFFNELMLLLEERHALALAYKRMFTSAQQAVVEAIELDALKEQQEEESGGSIYQGVLADDPRQYHQLDHQLDHQLVPSGGIRQQRSVQPQLVQTLPQLYSDAVTAKKALDAAMHEISKELAKQEASSTRPCSPVGRTTNGTADEDDAPKLQLFPMRGVQVRHESSKQSFCERSTY
jgi:hypothetical protein